MFLMIMLNTTFALAYAALSFNALPVIRPARTWNWRHYLPLPQTPSPTRNEICSGKMLVNSQT